MLGLRTDRERKLSGDYSSILIQLASPSAIRSWSYGEVTKPETINYRTFKPEKDGLFCERIFGPVKDWECNCGKYKRIRYRGIVCDKCGVEVTQSKVRRERLGHIELAVPVAHIWFFKGLPSRIGHLLDFKLKDLERVLYYESYAVLDPGTSGLELGQMLSEEEYDELLDSVEGVQIRVGMGAESIRELLTGLDLPALAVALKDQAANETSVQRKKHALKRLKIIQNFLNSNNDPTWMILDAVPVLPPDLRPLVPLDGGRFATSDLNDLYRRVINRNNRLKKLIEIKAPGVILRNEKRMLQEAVDALFDNGRRSRAVKGQGNRPLKSLSDMLKGKKGRFRQNLLGKRVDYSGRSVIVVGPELKLYQCGLPKTMALELFKPLIIRKLEQKGYVQTVKSAKKLVEKERPEVWDILDEIIKDHPVLLNRAPTLHRLGIQAFEPVLVEGKAIRIHPLACAAFNADFDGDQMAVHVPLGYEAQLEARLLMLAPLNILSPASGEPVATPSQDMVLGLFYLTRMREKGGRGEGKIFSSLQDTLQALDHGLVDKHAKIRVRVDGKIHETTAGRCIFNGILPEGWPFVNEEIGKRQAKRLIGEIHGELGVTSCMEFLDALKYLGFEEATTAGLTIGIEDILIPDEKNAVIVEARKLVAEIGKDYTKGKIGNSERYNRVIDRWTSVSDQVADDMFTALSKDRDGFNPIYMMHASGARGSRDQIRQLGAMRGLMAKPQKKFTGGVGEIIEQPILSNFREGLTVLEYFISTHGARKGLADTALKTADAGYLTRRLVDVSQDIVVTEHDCGTILGLDVGPLKEGEEVIEPLSDRIHGRTLADDVIGLDGELLFVAGTILDASTAQEIDDAGIDEVSIRSVLTCEARRGICALCYGYNLGESKLVDIGEPVGVIAAQSIGEPGTQLTLRTFHIGGTASRITEETIKHAAADGTIEFSSAMTTVRFEGNDLCAGRKGEMRLVLDSGIVRSKFDVPYGAEVLVKGGAKVKEGAGLFQWDPYSDPILSKVKGTAEYRDIVEGITLAEEIDDASGRRQSFVKESTDKNLHPTIVVVDSKGEKLEEYIIPTGAMLLTRDGEKVVAGTTLCKMARNVGQSRDITGGLPRVAELFESRRPKDAATITEIDGVVSFGGVTRGMRKIVVTPEGADENDAREYLIPHGRNVRTFEGEKVLAGESLTAGPVDPIDILKIQGANAVQAYLVNAIQEVYRLQGVKINDKHIEIIVSRMLQKVMITDPGDTDFLEEEVAGKSHVRDANERIQAKNQELLAQGKEPLQPAIYEPQLLGITKASLATDSFISAASFQETTRVLTQAAIQSQRDELHSLKENVIMGHLISAGTGMNRYKYLTLDPRVEPAHEAGFDADGMPLAPGGEGGERVQVGEV
jgi:DNA-directed RNA polymerase subunit beta'